jgi:hypothetical protein
MAGSAGDNGMESVDTVGSAPTQSQYPKLFPKRYPNLAVKLFCPGTNPIFLEKVVKQLRGEYAVRQRCGEPELTRLGSAEDSVREQCQV